jgi:putative transposase
MDKKELKNIVIAIKYRIDTNKDGTHFLSKSFAAARKYWNWQVDRQTKNWDTRNERTEEWKKSGGEKHLQDLKDKMKKDLADGVYEEKSDEHKAVQKEIRCSGFPLLDIAQADKDFRKLRKGDDKEYNWIKETPSRLVGGQYKRLAVSYREGFKKRRVKGFWKSKKDFAKKPNKGFPRFRSWMDNQYFDCEANQMKWEWEKNRFKLPLCKTWIKFKQHINMQEFLEKHPKAKLGMCVFTRTPTNKYYVFIPVDTGVPMPEKKEFDESNTVGIDVGIKNYITLSDESKIENSVFLDKFGLEYSDDKLSPYKTDQRLLRRKKIRQRRLARKEFKSKNYNKQRLVCAKIDEAIKNKRDDFTHELSRSLVDMPFNAFAVEDLNIAQMKEKKAPIKGKDGKYKRNGRAQQRGMSRRISDVAWGSFFTKFQYKADHSGKHMIRIDRFEPTSKKCGCGYIYNDLKLSQRVWECPECGVVNDRDKLAAMNIKNYVLGGKND